MRVLFVFLCLIILCFGNYHSEIRCSDLLPGQYKCDEPYIDNLTQQPMGCSDPSGIARSKSF